MYIFVVRFHLCFALLLTSVFGRCERKKTDIDHEATLLLCPVISLVNKCIVNTREARACVQLHIA